jgi:predicted transposase/invertase (TIGR01784 family)
MQTSKSDDDLKRRAEYCTGLLISSQEAKGIHYRDIKRVYQIFFLDCELFPDSGKFPRRYFHQEEDEHDRLSDLSEIMFYELPKLEQWFKDFQEGKVGTEPLTSEQKWCLYMKYRHIKQAKLLIETLCRREEGIMKAEKAVYKISRDSKRAARRMSEIIGRMDYDIKIMDAAEKGKAEGKTQGIAEGIAQGLEQGITQGIAQGKAESKAENARNALKEGLSVEVVQRITGLDMKTIKNIQAKL